MKKGESKWGREEEKEERSEAGTEREKEGGGSGDRKWQGRDREKGWEKATEVPGEVEDRQAGMEGWRQELRRK